MTLDLGNSEWRPIAFPDGPKAQCARIIKEVARRYGLEASDVLSDKRSAAISMCRCEAAAICARDTTMSLAGIGRAMRKDHSTIIWAIRRYNTIHGTAIRNCGVVTPAMKARKHQACLLSKERRQAGIRLRTEKVAAQNRIDCSPAAIAAALANVGRERRA